MNEKNEMRKKKEYNIPLAQPVQFSVATVIIASGGHEEHETWDHEQNK